MNVEKAREEFPYLRSGKIYFNHASTGPLSQRVLNNIAKVLYEKSETNIDEFLGLQAVIKESKGDLASMINTTPDRIAYVDNTSNGINIIAQGVKWKRGDRVLLNDLEFPANVYPFLNLKNEGVEIDFVKSHNGIVSAEDIIESIKPATRLVSISQVQFLTGYRADLEKIGKVCKEKGIIFSIDAIQGLGAIRLDVQKCNIDFLSAGSQKWMLGLQGLGMVYISEKVQQELEPKYIGWLSVDDAWNLLRYDLNLKKSADCFQGGTLNSVGIYALDASLKFFMEFGFDKIEEMVLENVEYLIKRLQSIGINPILKDCSKENLSGIVSFKHENSQKIFDGLSMRNIHCAVREGYVRLSPHFYNVKEETDKVIEVLREIIS
ncbi:MAG: aminotransferase class V-fold PLP-dependent enzyme [Ignavibacteriaceae bacterium]